MPSVWRAAVDTEAVRVLLELPPERGVDPALDGNAALRLASENGHTEVVQVRLDLPPERGVDPATDNSVPLRVGGRVRTGMWKWCESC